MLKQIKCVSQTRGVGFVGENIKWMQGGVTLFEVSMSPNNVTSQWNGDWRGGEGGNRPLTLGARMMILCPDYECKKTHISSTPLLKGL